MITEGENKQLKYPNIWTYEEYQDINNPNPEKLYWNVEEKKELAQAMPKGKFSYMK